MLKYNQPSESLVSALLSFKSLKHSEKKYLEIKSIGNTTKTPLEDPQLTTAHARPRKW